MSKKVLVVEDDPAQLAVIEHALRREGLATLGVGSAEEALRSLDDEAFDLMIVDIMLPGKDGYSLCREVKKNGHLGNEEVPIVVLSVLSGEGSVVEGLEAGADDYIAKPFSCGELVSRVRGHFGERAASGRERLEQQRLETERERPIPAFPSGRRAPSPSPLLAAQDHATTTAAIGRRPSARASPSSVGTCRSSLWCPSAPPGRASRGAPRL